MIDHTPDLYLTAPFKTNALEVFVVGKQMSREEALKYIPIDKGILLEVLCEDGVYFVLVRGEDYIKWW